MLHKLKKRTAGLSNALHIIYRLGKPTYSCVVYTAQLLQEGIILV
jgi:hypothetical protein